jgi:hypothetical protein
MPDTRRYATAHVEHAPDKIVACAACRDITRRPPAQRVHKCAHSGHTPQRDQNTASVVLIDAHAPGTDGAARQTSGAATRQVKVCDLRKPFYSAAGSLAADEFIKIPSKTRVSQKTVLVETQERRMDTVCRSFIELRAQDFAVPTPHSLRGKHLFSGRSMGVTRADGHDHQK